MIFVYPGTGRDTIEHMADPRVQEIGKGSEPCRLG